VRPRRACAGPFRRASSFSSAMTPKPYDAEGVNRGATLYDEVSFDPNYANEPLDAVEPMVPRVRAKEWTPLA
jgi:hypothetical protein